jgi:hypothetical protein
MITHQPMSVSANGITAGQGETGKLPHGYLNMYPLKTETKEYDKPIIEMEDF